MLWINTKRVIRSGFVSFARNGFVSLSSVLIITVTLFVLGGMIFVGATLKASLAEIQSKVDVNVYFTTDASEGDITALKNKLSSLPEVAAIEYISRAQALENFKARHVGDDITLQALEELGENPLGAILNIRTKETSQYAGVAKFLDAESESQPGLVDRTNYAQNKTAIDTLARMISGGTKIAFAITLLLALVSIIIVFNTIRLSIYIAREEISVMRLVGASNRYIRGPFIISGVLYGVVSALVTLTFLYPAAYWVASITATFFGGFNVFSYYISHFPQILGIILGTGVLLGAISSYLAVRKYLRI